MNVNGNLLFEISIYDSSLFFHGCVYPFTDQEHGLLLFIFIGITENISGRIKSFLDHRVNDDLHRGVGAFSPARIG